MMRVKIVLITLVILLNVQMLFGIQIANAENDRMFTENDKEQLDSLIKKQMQEAKIPGMSVIVVKGDQAVYKKSFGYSNLETKQRVTEKTLFEIGSNSKAFTALAIYQLVQKGLIDLKDPVSKYLQWFQMIYEGNYKGQQLNKNVEITLEQLLYHTSGIPFHTIGDIPISNDNDALENTVREILNQKLETYPGEQFNYASINYDILGLVIQKVTNQSFEQYVQNNILNQFNMGNTFLFRKDVVKYDMSKGYKIGFLKPIEFNAPIYRGNTPAGYFISNNEDMEKWLRMQLGIYGLSDDQQKAIYSTHIPNRSVPPSEDGSSYAGGWQVFQNGPGEISHAGSNPNFSSFVVFHPQEKLGVAVMANMNSDYTQNIGQAIMDTLVGESVVTNGKDTYKSIDAFSVTVLLFMVPFSIITLYFIFIVMIQVYKKKRKLEKNKFKSICIPFITFLFAFLAGYALYKIPFVFFGRLSWDFVNVWLPISMSFAVWATLISIVLFCLYLSLITVFPLHNKKNFFPIFVLSVTSGFGNAMIIFIINEALTRSNYSSNNSLFLYFLLGIITYVLAQKLVRTQLITITNNLIYEKRIQLINDILKNPYEKIEKIESERIQTTLNNDTEAISNYAATIITGLTDSITLLCCLVYLGVINVYGLLVSIAVILVAAGMYYVAGKSANNLWEQTRNIQNTFFRYINDLIGGYKELSIGKSKREEFGQGMQESCEDYKDKRIQGGLKFANVFIIGELLFVMVIGAVTFLFPLLFKGVQSEFLRSYVFVFLYMTGPLHSILNTIPNAIQMKISWKRINDFSRYLKTETNKTDVNSTLIPQSKINMEIKEVVYQYESEHGEAFQVGPINFELKSGEVVFITGGNGSGKSTLAKLITGLYSANSGNIFVNNQEINQEQLRELYSAIFSDFYLFTKVYGIDYSSKEEEIKKYLKILRIDEKVQIQNGEFSTTKLSTGQRKRLALLISYLEDKSIYLFDEWAADQDPEFRHFFYIELLAELKGKGKAIIAITHDDRYFHIADKVIKMERGEIIENMKKHNYLDSFDCLKEELNDDKIG
ncbi:cyclic peptide export ABC transporter [Bacillus wiedmannii]|uniref:cyclic peptide export ABC transporter n=1 Tax=Bacillus wiedmannii TaxID=1890302 RepID=UPI000B431F0A|nr:cyclic peptide export ABC transporter [Bacillus wiedmannii]OUB80384.1 peptide ABC transporter [Bacillus thuringiensis serovar sinensis]